MKLVLNKDLMDKMVDHAIESYPMECCGFVFGKEQPDGRILSEVHRAPNNQSGDQRRRFEIDPLDYLKAERYALENGITLLGIYHSHPDHPAVPSIHDLKQAVPFFSYLILAAKKGQVDNITSWQLLENEFEEEKITIENRIETLN